MSLDKKIRCICLSLFMALGQAAFAAEWAAPPDLPDIEVVDQDGKSYRLMADLIKGRSVAINFIFTGCVAICPPQTAIFRALHQSLNHPRKKNAPLLLSISVDPLGDNAEALKKFAQKFDADTGLDKGWLFLTGRPPAIEKLLAKLNVMSGGRESHAAVMWLGDEPKQRWTRTSSLNNPVQLANLLHDISN